MNEEAYPEFERVSRKGNPKHANQGKKNFRASVSTYILKFLMVRTALNGIRLQRRTLTLLLAWLAKYLMPVSSCKLTIRIFSTEVG